jgi:hypothetical protein
MTMTLEIPDELMRKAQDEAAARGESLQDFLTEAISSKLMPEVGGSKPSVMSYAGIFRDSREESARIMETIETACEQIQPEDWK